MKNNIYVGLVHYPILNKNGNVITTSVTNLDIHDISRSCCTFGVQKYFLITPLEMQHRLVNRILGHWSKDESSSYNPDRQEALSLATLISTVDEGIERIKEIEKKSPILAVTGANFEENSGVESDLLSESELDKRPIFLVFGTGWGLHKDILEKADFSLCPIFGAKKDGYNHLSVRSAVAIYLDRIINSRK